MQNDDSIATKPTSDVANTSAIPTTVRFTKPASSLPKTCSLSCARTHSSQGTSNILDGKGSSANTNSAADSKPGVGLFDAQGAIGKQFST